MAKLKLIYEKESFNIKRRSEAFCDYTYSLISDTEIPMLLYKLGIDVVKAKNLYLNRNLIILKQKEKKKLLKCKVFAALSRCYKDKINIIYLG